MTLYVFDAAYAPTLRKVKAAGGIAMNGYLTGIYAGTTSQPGAVRAAGLGYLPTYEEGPGELVHATRATGQAVGRKILAAFKAKGIPLDGTVAAYPSVDVSVAIDGTDHDADACNEGWRGMRDVLAGKVSLRAYAEGAVIDALVNARLVDGKCWLAAPTSWPGYKPTSSNVCLVQEVGSPVGGTDRNHLVTDAAALGAWWPAGSKYAATTEGNPLADLTKAQLDQIAAAVWGWDHIVAGSDPKNPTWAPSSILRYTMSEVLAAKATVEDNGRKLSGVAQVLGASGSGVAARVASLQSAVAALALAVDGLGPAAVEVDTKAIVDAVDAELAKLPGEVRAALAGLSLKVEG